VLAANRDEFHGRPAEPLHWWPDEPAVLAGRDLQAGGTWLGLSRSGRFATVTNYRERQAVKTGLESRGALVADFLTGDADAAGFIDSIDGDRYAGFSLLAGDGNELWYVSNRGDGPDKLPPGVYGLSNASLDTPWFKLVRSRDALRDLVAAGPIDLDELMHILADRQRAPEASLDSTDLPLEFARAISSPFIVAPDYGTRCTSALTWSRSGEVRISERRFDADGRNAGESGFSFVADES
jgi:uncharacterized protein with NRDE domain